MLSDQGRFRLMHNEIPCLYSHKPYTHYKNIRSQLFDANKSKETTKKDMNGKSFLFSVVVAPHPQILFENTLSSAVNVNIYFSLYIAV